MDTALPRTEESRHLHWTVRINYKYRTVSFFLIFIGLSLHLYAKGASATLWTLLALQFLVSPHLLYWRALRATNPQQAEMNNLSLDAFLIGMWVAALHFPLWPTFSMWMGCSLNIAINKGWKGMLPATLLFFTGIVMATVMVGFRFEPDTAWPTTALSFITPPRR
jgi:diguanylate cyclase